MEKGIVQVDTSPAISKYDPILSTSAKEFRTLLADMKSSGLDMKKIHDFNSEVAGLADDKDITPEEMLCALELLAKYIVMHSNLSGGKRVNRIISLLGFDVDKIARSRS